MTTRVFSPDERPDVEVLVDGVWHQGELRMWTRREDGWWAQVQWRRRPGETYLDTVPAASVRLAEGVDVSTSDPYPVVLSGPETH